MGKPSNTRPAFFWYLHALAAMLVVVWLASMCAQTTQATVVPLLLPAGIIYDKTGTLYLAETNAHQILAVSSDGTLSVIAGTGIQGYAGDGGPALAARLDSPAALSISPEGDLYVADTHNHVIRRIVIGTGIISTVAGTGLPGSSADGARASTALLDQPVALTFDSSGNLFFADARTHRVRRIDASTTLVTTVAGSGQQGFAGDGGSALLASLDTPSGLAIDNSGAIFLSDSHNHRIRRIDANTHIISTIAGTGAPVFSGDGSAATTAGLRLPRGLTLDASGNLLIADAQNSRIRRVDASTGLITTLAGNSAQRFAGDGDLAVKASLNSPRAVTLSPAGLVTLADSANGRIRQIDNAAIIHTIAGLGGSAGSVLTLVSPSTVTYGTGTITATLAASPATGSITFLDTASTQPTTLATTPLSGNLATFSTASLPAGTHLLTATYTGDSTHLSAQSPVVTLKVSSASLLISPVPVSVLYGQTIPPLTGSLTGLLPVDAGSVTVVLGSAATSQSHPAAYPVSGVLTGAAAANYSLTVAPIFVTIEKAPVSVTLGTSGGVTAHVTSSTSGTPTGAATLLDGSQVVASTTLVAGFAGFNPVLANGAHTLTAGYSGDIDFLPATSAASVFTVNPGPTPDFTLVAVGQTSQTIPAGSAASFTFNLNPVNGSLTSAIQLSVSGLPSGATASFNPAYIPPGGSVQTTILTIQTLHASLEPLASGPLQPILALAVPILLLIGRRRPRRFLLAILAGLSLISMTACGDRVSTSGQAASIRPYLINVTGTATSAAGTTLQHSAAVTLNVQ